jgi:hypothetical protein
MTRIQRVGRGLERFLEAWGVEQPEGDVQCLAEAPVGVVVDVAGVHDDTDPQLPVRAVDGRNAGIVFGQQLAEGRHGPVQQERLGGLVNWVYEGEDAVAAVGEPVTMAPADSRREQSLVEEIVERIEMRARMSIYGITGVHTRLGGQDEAR